MNKSISWVFLSVSIVFFLFIVGLTGYRIEDTRTRTTYLVKEKFNDLATRAESIRATYIGLDSPAARKELRQIFDGEPRLLLLSVHSSFGMEYLVTRNREYLKEPAVLNNQWRGTPVYETSRGYDVVLSRTLGDDPSQAVVDGMFVIMGREDLYPVIRDDLFLFLAFLLVSGVVILIAMSIQQDLPPGPSGHGARRDPNRGAASAPGRPEGQGLVSPRTGLVWAEHFDARLRSELERAASADQDLSLARIRIDDPSADYGEIASLLQQAFPVHDCLFEAGRDAFSVLLPDIDVDTAVRNLESFRTAVASRQLSGRNRSLSIGVTSRAGRLISGPTLVEEADVSLAKASREGGNRVIGFRADPSLYRENLSAAR